MNRVQVHSAAAGNHRLASPMVAGPAATQAQSSQTDLCSLLTPDEIEAATGRKMYGPPQPMALGSTGGLCHFEHAQVIVFEGPNSEAAWDSMVVAFGYPDLERTPVPELGDRAYWVHPEPKTKYQDDGVFVVVASDARTIAVSVNAAEGQPAESVLPAAIDLSALVLQRLP